MKGRACRLLLGVALLALAFACGLALGAADGYVAALQVVGDVETTLELRSLDELSGLQRLRIGGKSCRGLSLAQLAAQAGAERVDLVLLVADDGFCAQLSGDTLDECWLSFDRRNGWHSLSQAHPLSANTVALSRIVFVDHSAAGLSVSSGGGGAVLFHRRFIQRQSVGIRLSGGRGGKR